MKVIRLFESGSSLDSSKKLLSRIKHDCEDFLRASVANPLWRGISEHDFDTRGNHLGSIYVPARETWRSVSKLAVRKDRAPMSTAKEVHDVTDEYFHERFGIKHRSSSLFATGNRMQALGYGGLNPYLILPIGAFEYVWSPVINDFFSDISAMSSVGEHPAIMAGIRKTFKKMGIMDKDLEDRAFTEKFEDEFTYAGFKRQAEIIKVFLETNPDLYTDSNLRAAILSGNEIMIACDEYYAIKVNGQAADVDAHAVLQLIKDSE